MLAKPEERYGWRNDTLLQPNVSTGSAEPTEMDY